MAFTVSNMVACLELGTSLRYSLHDVFRALPFVPAKLFLYIEFEHEADFSFQVRVTPVHGEGGYETEEFAIGARVSGFSEFAVELPGRVAGLLPGRYNVEVIRAADAVVVRRGTVFFGEM